MIKVYIASPYTNGSQAENVRQQMMYFKELVLNGYCPFAPLLFHFQEIFSPLPYEKYTELDLEWVRVCDCILRLPGKSLGADDECNFAQRCKLPVFYSLTDLFEHYGTLVKR
jgi:hypothetical protein